MGVSRTNLWLSKRILFWQLNNNLMRHTCVLVSKGMVDSPNIRCSRCSKLDDQIAPANLGLSHGWHRVKKSKAPREEVERDMPSLFTNLCLGPSGHRSLPLKALASLPTSRMFGSKPAAPTIHWIHSFRNQRDDQSVTSKLKPQRLGRLQSDSQRLFEVRPSG